MEDTSAEKLKALAEKAKEFALLSGFQVRRKETPNSSELVHHFPFTLFPSEIPRGLFNQAKALQTDFNLMMHRVAHDHEFLYNSLKRVIEVDDFTRNLWNIYETVRKEGVTQPVCLGLFRNDFMVDTGRQKVTDINMLKLKQIEFNTICVGSGGVVTPLREVHRYVLSQAEIEFDEDKLPLNNCAYEIARGIVRAWEVYGNPKAYVLFMVDKVERNRLDQVWLEKAIFTINRDCKVMYQTLKDLAMIGVLNGDKTLIVDGKEIAVAYYRTCYAPKHYSSQKDWDTRLLIERSNAIKCPPIQYQLAGTKKIQQELTKPGAVERFLDDPESVKKVRDTFAGQFALDKGPEGDAAFLCAHKQPSNYVVKPQREGGGNNMYDEDIPKFLEYIKDSEERSAYVIMERLFPYVQANYLVLDELLRCNVTNEIGIYGVFIGSASDVVENFEAGHKILTKKDGLNEGTLYIGIGALDTPYLVNDI